METFGKEYAPILAEFVFTGVLVSLSRSLENDLQVREFIGIVRKRCADQNFETEAVEAVLNILAEAIALVRNNNNNT